MVIKGYRYNMVIEGLRMVLSLSIIIIHVNVLYRISRWEWEIKMIYMEPCLGVGYAPPPPGNFHVL